MVFKTGAAEHSFGALWSPSLVLGDCDLGHCNGSTRVHECDVGIGEIVGAKCVGDREWAVGPIPASIVLETGDGACGGSMQEIDSGRCAAVSIKDEVEVGKGAAPLTAALRPREPHKVVRLHSDRG